MKIPVSFFYLKPVGSDWGWCGSPCLPLSHRCMFLCPTPSPLSHAVWTQCAQSLHPVESKQTSKMSKKYKIWWNMCSCSSPFRQVKWVKSIKSDGICVHLLSNIFILILVIGLYCVCSNVCSLTGVAVKYRLRTFVIFYLID